MDQKKFYWTLMDEQSNGKNIIEKFTIWVANFTQLGFRVLGILCVVVDSVHFLNYFSPLNYIMLFTVQKLRNKQSFSCICKNVATYKNILLHFRITSNSFPHITVTINIFLLVGYWLIMSSKIFKRLKRYLINIAMRIGGICKYIIQQVPMVIRLDNRIKIVRTQN